LRMGAHPEGRCKCIDQTLEIGNKNIILGPKINPKVTKRTVSVLTKFQVQFKVL